MGRMYKMEQTERSSRSCPLRGSNGIHAPSKHDFSLFYPAKQERKELLTPAVERDLKYSFQARLFPLQGWGLIDLPLRAFNAGSPRPRVAREQKIIRLHPTLCSASRRTTRSCYRKPSPLV